MNKIGQVSIDSAAVPEDTPLKELLNGCVCCTLSDKLEVQMYDLLENHNIDVIYIETTGVAHPLEVLDACLSPLLEDKVSIGAIISVIDAYGWSNRQSFKRPLQKLITEQAKHADVIVLNKVDLISKEKQEEIMNELLTLNHSSKIMTAEFTNIDADRMSVENTLKDSSREKLEQESRWITIKSNVALDPINVLWHISQEFFKSFFIDRTFKGMDICFYMEMLGYIMLMVYPIIQMLE